MAPKESISRRQFVTTAISAAAVTAIPAKRVFAKAMAGGRALPQTAVTLTDSPNWKDQGVENLTKSPHAKLRDVPVHAVTITGNFWASRREISATKSIPSMHDLLESNGRMNNFRRLVGKSDAKQIGPVFSDSDPYKWTEAVGFVLQSGPNPALRASAEKFIDDVVATQKANGYLNTYYVDDKAALSMTVQTQ